MPKQIHLLIFVFSLALTGVETSSVEAQHLRSRQPFQAGFRWLGQGWSAGYHHQNPGPNSDYYNPYTAHNSMLISRMPGYQAGQRQYGYHTNAHGSSNSNYHSGSSWGQVQGQSIQPTFVPVDDEDSDDEDNDNDFDPDELPKVSSDPGEPGSIRVDEDSEDADFEESSFDGDDAFDDIEAEAGSGSRSKPSGSGSKSSGSGSKSRGSKTKTSGSGTKAKKTGFAGQVPDSVESLDFRSFMVN